MHVTPELFAIVFGGLLALMLARVFQYRVDAIARQASTVSRLEGKLDLLLNDAGLMYDPYKGVPPSVAEAVKQGSKIEAIKRYREVSSVSLKEAKEFVEGVQRRAGVS